MEASSNIWRDLPASIKSEIESSSKIFDLKRGDTIYRQGEKPLGLYLVRRGLVGLVLTGASSGREHLLRFFKEGQYFGHRALFSNEGYHGTSIALEATQIEMIPGATVLRILDEHPRLYRGFLSVLAKELRRCEVQHVLVLENQILPRLAQALVYLKDLHPQHRWTRLEIANFCASTVSTIIKALAELESLGYIRQEGRSIHILNRNALVSLQDCEGR